MNQDNDIYRTRETLLEKIKNKHDDKSWEEFVFYYRKYIYIICRRMKLNHHDAEEVVQQVLLYSWNKLPEFVYDEKKKFRGWLCQMSVNFVKNFYKRIKNHNNKISKVSETIIPDDPDCTTPDIEKIAEEEWNLYITTMAMMNIKYSFSEKVMDIFEKLIKGGTPTTISEETGIPPNTISVYKKRVTAKLSAEINRLNHEIG